MLQLGEKEKNQRIKLENAESMSEAQKLELRRLRFGNIGTDATV